MISERFLTLAVRAADRYYLRIRPYKDKTLPKAETGKKYMLYAHVPFCESLCPYCSFNRYPFEETVARSYFDCLRREMRMVAELGYDFDSMYIGGGTPTILPDELAATICLAKELFSIKEVSTETNPNHLDDEHLEPVRGLVDRMSVGVQSFDDGLLKRMCRYHKYGSGRETADRISKVSSDGIFRTFNVDMIFNFPQQTEEMIREDIRIISSCGCNQVTFYPLMAAPSVKEALCKSLGKVDHRNEKNYYELICRELTGGLEPEFEHGSVWTFKRTGKRQEDRTRSDNSAAEYAADARELIDEYVVDHEEYPAVGAGSMAFLNREYFINAFSLEGYEERIRSGHMGIWGSVKFSKRDHMRYRLLMQLFGMRLDKKRWREDFGCSIEKGLPAEYLFLKKAGAFEKDDENEITLSKEGRYLLLVMMREFFTGVNTVRDKARKSGC